ncbi:response regulator transcription factor [Spongiactinospora sp. TRM90649]|uniref:response regulator n=1 Tax=Spongiactinospora sp. TRM90649 TaxID=3031114 RepID=UPI0023F93906|nr:response regulator transcription factor [Spongiactinospora sp. TRM90649]MDF5751611.1 response regulator transcription factor [Spongiactinospora sp. TRM90649]
MSVRIVVVDDHELVRAGFHMILDAQPDMEVVAEASDGAQAVEMATRLRPDVVLMDIRMPRMDGLEATRRLAGPDVRDPVKVLVLTTFDLDDHVYEALRAGASGFLLKDLRRDDLVNAVRVVAAGDALLAPSITRRLIGEFARPPRPEERPTPELGGLTAREREVLSLMARGRSNAEIAAGLVIGEETVKTHVSNVLAKLHLRDRVHAVILAYEIGLVRPGVR